MSTQRTRDAAGRFTTLASRSLAEAVVKTASPSGPRVGQTVVVPDRGLTGTIIAIHPFGTLDIECQNGRCYRLSGLTGF